MGGLVCRGCQQFHCPQKLPRIQASDWLAPQEANINNNNSLVAPIRGLLFGRKLEERSCHHPAPHQTSNHAQLVQRKSRMVLYSKASSGLLWKVQRQLPTTSAAAIIFDRAFTPSFEKIQVRDRDYLRKPSTYHQCTGSEDLNYQFSANLLIHGVLTPGLNFDQRSCVFSHITQWLSLCFPGMEHRPVGSLLNFEVMVGSRTISTYSSQPMRLWADIFFPALHSHTVWSITSIKPCQSPSATVKINVKCQPTLPRSDTLCTTGWTTDGQNFHL